MQPDIRCSIASAHSSFLWLHKDIILFSDLIVLTSAILLRSGSLGSLGATLSQRKQFSYHLNKSTWKEDDAEI